MKQWTLTKLIRPTTDRIVEIQDSAGNISKLRYHNNLWWTSDNVMYVYFTPIAWREIN